MDPQITHNVSANSIGLLNGLVILCLKNKYKHKLHVESERENNHSHSHSYPQEISSHHVT